jgi:hypothetical protein
MTIKIDHLNYKVNTRPTVKDSWDNTEFVHLNLIFSVSTDDCILVEPPHYISTNFTKHRYSLPTVKVICVKLLQNLTILFLLLLTSAPIFSRYRLILLTPDSVKESISWEQGEEIAVKLETVRGKTIGLAHWSPELNSTEIPFSSNLQMWIMFFLVMRSY